MEAQSEADLGKTFEDLFEILPALTPVDIDEVYRIRHEVYCRDLHWEPERPDGRESDEYDRHSIHCLLRRRGTGESVGCARLILRRPEDPAYPLPIERSCKDVLGRGVDDPATIPRDRIGEISRLAVLSSFRMRKGESEQPVAISSEDYETRGKIARFPFITVSLFFGAAVIVRHFGIEHAFVLTEPRLASHFERIGFAIRPVGGPIEHHGTRVPSLLINDLDGLRPRIRPLFEAIETDFERAFDAHPSALPWMRMG